jgi:branched-chain amino acid transport system ATP-binding protein
MTALLELSNVSVSYGSMRALTDVSLVVPEGCVVALLGPNGAGKTTTLRTISGLVRPERGAISFRGQPIHRYAPHRVASLGVLHVPEGRGIFRSLTVGENLQMATYATGRAADGRRVVESSIAMFPALAPRLKQAAGTLSGGEQQMLAMARAFAAGPQVIMLDEISMGLAPIITEQLFEAIRTAAANGVSMLLIEQYVDAALDLADYCYVLEKGRVVDVGQPADLRNSDALAAAYLGAGVAS